jgi:transcription-repair coupling factor (superfamily II helicase)
MTAERILLGGAPEGFDARLRRPRTGARAPVIHVARDDKRMEAMRAALAVMAPEVAVLDFPPGIACPTTGSPNPEISARGWRRWRRWPRAARTLRAADHAERRDPAPAAREVVRAASFRAEVGDRVDEALR